MALIDEVRKKSMRAVRMESSSGEVVDYQDCITLSDLEEILKNYKSPEEVEQIRKEAYEKAIEDIKVKIIKGLSIFTEKPLGTIESDLCDWDKPSTFAHNYSPAELQNTIIKRVNEIFKTEEQQ